MKLDIDFLITLKCTITLDSSDAINLNQFVRQSDGAVNEGFGPVQRAEMEQIRGLGRVWTVTFASVLILKEFLMIMIAFRCACIVLHYFASLELVSVETICFQLPTQQLHFHRPPCFITCPKDSASNPMEVKAAVRNHALISAALNEADPQNLLQTGSCDRCCGPKDRGRGTAAWFTGFQ